MKENSIEKLQERLETLHMTQDARLACNADDLDIREEIAEVEEEIKELQDETMEENGIKNEQNSIEEDMIILVAFNLAPSLRHISETEFKDVQRALDNLLLDYKRVLGINEILEKENKELKKNCTNIQESNNITSCKVIPPPEPQLPTKTLCESFSKKGGLIYDRTGSNRYFKRT